LGIIFFYPSYFKASNGSIVQEKLSIFGLDNLAKGKEEDMYNKMIYFLEKLGFKMT